MHDLEKLDSNQEFGESPSPSRPHSLMELNDSIDGHEEEKPVTLHEQQTATRNRFNDWDGPDDPANPFNWPLWLRIYHTTAPGGLAFAVVFGTSVYTPAIADIMQDFHVSRTAAIIPLSLYVLGLAFGPVISAPLSETHGRKVVYLVTFPLSMLFTLGAGFSQSFASLVVCRFLAGFTGSPVLAVGAGTNADVFPPRQRAIVTSFFLMAPFAGPAFGPLVGGFAAQYKGWRWTQWSILFISLAVYLITLPMRETYKKIILKRRAEKEGLEPSLPAASLKSSFVLAFLRPLHMLLTEPIVFFLSLYTAFAFGVLFIFFAAFPYVFQRPPYNFTISQTGLTFLAIALGVSFAAVSGIAFDRTMYQRQHKAAEERGEAHAQPEHRLYNAMLGSFGLPIGLFWFAWSADRGSHWAVPVVAAVPFAWGNLCLFISSALYLTDVYGPQNGASAMAANGIFRYTLSAVFPLFTIQMYSGMGIGWATTLLGILSVAMLPIPWILFKYGPEIRKRSQYPVIM